MVRNKHNTTGIIKYQFWQMTAENQRAINVCINKGESYSPVEIKDRSICINGDVREILEQKTV